ncbi:MAG: alpha/beta hydrolase [Chloroflexi bacterium]|nr:alpha/beta hydrolase [Chloroflexota bacterium]
MTSPPSGSPPTPRVAERAIQIAGERGALVGRLHVPAGDVRAAAVLCHPHPLYGGDMHNHVVDALACGLAADGVLALRFNFRGVGGSAGLHDGGPGEVRDVLAAFEALRAERGGRTVPLAVVGYSFGAAVGLAAAAQHGDVAAAVGVSPPFGRSDFCFLADVAFPVLLIWGQDDALVDAAAAQRVAAYQTVRTIVVPGADHFWRTGVERVVAAAAAFLRAPGSGSTARAEDGRD